MSLPVCFEISAASLDIAPYGAVLGDQDFSAGRDIVIYQIETGQVAGTLTVFVELLYQSIGYRWAENLRVYDTSEVDQFFVMYDTLDKFPVVVAEAMQTITP